MDFIETIATLASSPFSLFLLLLTRYLHLKRDNKDRQRESECVQEYRVAVRFGWQTQTFLWGDGREWWVATLTRQSSDLGQPWSFPLKQGRGKAVKGK